MPLLSLLAICLICWCARTARAGTTDTPPAQPPRAVWGGLILATNEPHPSQAEPRLRQYESKLKNIFGYNHFEIVGEDAQKIDGANGHMLAPGKEFSVAVSPRAEPGAPGQPGGMRMILYRNRKRLAEFEAHLSSGAALFIRGPMYAKGQLVIVLHAMDPAEIPHILHPGPPPPPVVTGQVIVTPVVGPGASAPKERVPPAGGPPAVAPIQPFYPPAGAAPPVDRGPLPADRGVVPGDHLQPFEGPDRGGDVEQKGAKP